MATDGTKNVDITSWIGRSEAARRARVSSEIVSKWLNDGRLKFIQTGIGRLIDPVDLERICREREGRVRKGGR